MAVLEGDRIVGGAETPFQEVARVTDNVQLGDRVAVVMAASKGLGRASAEALAATAYCLVICSRGQESLDEEADRLRSAGAAVAVEADVGKARDIESVFAVAQERFGLVDALVCNAGGPPPDGFTDVSNAQWQLGFELTFMRAVRAIRAALAGMIERRFGRVVVIGPSSVKQPIENLTLSNAFRRPCWEW